MYLFNLENIPDQPSWSIHKILKTTYRPTLSSRKTLKFFSPTKWIVPQCHNRMSMEQIPRSHLFKSRSIQRRADSVAKGYDEKAKREQDLKILRNKLVLNPRDSRDYNIFIPAILFISRPTNTLCTSSTSNTSLFSP